MTGEAIASCNPFAAIAGITAGTKHETCLKFVNEFENEINKCEKFIIPKLDAPLAPVSRTIVSFADKSKESTGLFFVLTASTIICSACCICAISRDEITVTAIMQRAQNEENLRIEERANELLEPHLNNLPPQAMHEVPFARREARLRALCRDTIEQPGRAG